MQNPFGDSKTPSELGLGTAGIASFLFIANFVSTAAVGVAFIIIARLLGPNGYGIYAIALGIIGILGPVSSMGVGRYVEANVPKLVSSGKRRMMPKLIGSVLLLLFSIGIVLMLVLLLLSRVITTYLFHSLGYMGLAHLTAIALLFSVIYYGGYSALVSFGDGKRATIAILSGTLTQAVASIILVLSGYGAFGAVLGYTTGMLLGLITNIYLLAEKAGGITFSMADIRQRLPKMFGFSMVVNASNASTTMVSNFAVILLGLLFVPSVAGVYGLAARIGSILGVVTSTITLVLVPMFSSAFAKAKISSKIGTVYGYSFYFGFLFTTPLVIYLAVLSTSLVSTLFFTSYVSAPLYVSLISIGLLLQLASLYGTSVAISLSHVKRVLRYSIITSIVELVLLLAMVPVIGALGAVISIYLAGGILSDLLYARYIKRILKVSMIGRTLRLAAPNIVLLVAMIALALSSIYATFQLVIGLVLLVALYPPLLGLTGSLDGSEAAFLKSASRRIPLFGVLLEKLVAYSEVFRLERDSRHA